jgi:predicted acetyltransferase
MTSLQLLSPSADSRHAFLAMAREWRAHGDDRYALALDDFTAFLERVRRAESPVQPHGRVPGTQFWGSSGEEIVGCFRLRFSLTPELEVEGGHIGYDVRPSQRGVAGHTDPEELDATG